MQSSPSNQDPRLESPEHLGSWFLAGAGLPKWNQESRNQDPRLESPEHLGSWFLVPGAGLHLT